MTTGDQRRAAIVRFIAAFHSDHGYGPSVREIAAGIGIASSGQTHEYLVQLVAAGRVVRLQVGTNLFTWAVAE